MKKILVLFALIILFAFMAVNYNTRPKVIISRLINSASIKKGELVYKIYLLGFIPVGEAAIKEEKEEAYNGLKVYHLKANASSLNTISRIFEGRANFDSYVNLKDLNPIIFKQKISVKGRASIDKEIIYDQNEHVMTLSGVRRQIFPDTQDPLSLLFRLKGIDFDKVRDLEMYINTNQKNYILQGSVKKRGLLIDKKTFDIFDVKAEIKRHDKNPYHKTSIDIVFLKDAILSRNIPLSIKIFASGMLIKVSLIDIK